VYLFITWNARGFLQAEIGWKLIGGDEYDKKAVTTIDDPS